MTRIAPVRIVSKTTNKCEKFRRYVDTKNQLADMLTKGSFTRDECCNLLRLFNIMKFSTFSRSHFRSVENATTKSQRIQERKTEGEPAAAKPKSVWLISTSLNRGQSSSCGPDVSNIPANPQLDSCLPKELWETASGT